MQKVQKMQSKNDTVPQKYLDIFVTIPHFFKITPQNSMRNEGESVSDY